LSACEKGVNVDSWKSEPGEDHQLGLRGIGPPPSPFSRRGRRKAASDAKVAALLSLPPLRAASRRQVELVAQAGDRVELAAGTTVVAEGSHGDWVYLVIEGTAAATRTRWWFGPGECLGALGYLAGEPAPMTVVASSDLRTLAIRSDHFAALLDTVPALRRAVTVSLARQLAATLRHHFQWHFRCDERATPALRLT
jgi:CRP-like cAMP-binding protein